MKTLFLSTVFLLAVTLVGRAQSADAGAETPPPNSTTIDSEELHMDQAAHTAIFGGNVSVTGTNFTMKCQEMTVNFDKENKIETIIAKGDVIIVQPGRITKSGLAVYHKDTDEFILTDQPIINNGGQILTAPKIIINRSSQSLKTEGKSRLVLPEGNGLMNKETTPAQK